MESVIFADAMTRPQLACCKLMARGMAGEYGKSFRLTDLRDIVWDGSCSPELTYSRVTFSVGLYRYSAYHVLKSGLYLPEFITLAQPKLVEV